MTLTLVWVGVDPQRPLSLSRLALDHVVRASRKPNALPVSRQRLAGVYEMDAASASQLAYYQRQDSVGVLALREWTCLFIFASDGDSLRVLSSGDLHGIEPGFEGPRSSW